MTSYLIDVRSMRLFSVIFCSVLDDNTFVRRANLLTCKVIGGIVGLDSLCRLDGSLAAFQSFIDLDFLQDGSANHLAKTQKDVSIRVLTFVYFEGDTIADNVYKISLAKGVPQDNVWKLVNGLEREIATQRGLI